MGKRVRVASIAPSILSLAIANVFAQSATPTAPASDAQASDKRLIVAQTAPETAAPSAPDSVKKADAKSPEKIEAITVTARRRTENVQDVPASISVVTAADIRKEGAVDFKDLAFSVGNLTIAEASNSPIQTEIWLRGVFTAGAAGMYVDDVFIGNNSGYATTLNDVASMQVLKGPQGTLYGKNTLAGAVVITTEEPSKSLEGEVSATGGNYNRRNFSALISGPIADGVYGKLALTSVNRGGFETSRIDGSKVNNQKNNGVRGSLLFAPTKDLSIRLNADYSRDDPTAFYFDALADRPGGTIASIDGSPYDRVIPGTTAVTGQNLAKRTVQGYSGKIEYTISPAIKFISVTAQRKFTHNLQTDSDYSPLDILFIYRPTTYKQDSQEFRLVGAHGRLDWVTGLFYFRDTLDNRTNSRLGTDFPANQLSPDFGPLTLGEVNALGISETPTGIFYTPSKRSSTSKAAYGSATYRITDEWSLTGGLRLNRESFTKTFTPGYLILAPIATTVPDSTTRSKTESDVSPSASVSYKWSPNTLSYFSFGKAFKGGDIDSEGKTVKPETITNYEVGLKSTLLDRRLVLNLAVFQMNYRDLQRTQVVGLNEVITNAAKSRIRGIEADLTVRPVPNFELRGSMGFVDAKYLSYTNAPVLLDTVETVFVDLSNTRLPGAPKFTANLGPEYKFTTGGIQAILGGQVQYKGPYRVNSGPAEIFKISSQTNLNLYATVQKEGGPWSVTFRAKNINNKAYRTNVDFSPFALTNYLALSDPRTYTLDLRYAF